MFWLFYVWKSDVIMHWNNSGKFRVMLEIWVQRLWEKTLLINLFFFKFQAVFENEEHKEAYVLLSDQLLINNTRNYFKHQCSNKTSECWWMSSKALELLMMCSARLGYLPRHRLHSFCRAVRTRRTFLGRQCIFSICFIDSFTVISYIQQLVNCALEQMFDS